MGQGAAILFATLFKSDIGQAQGAASNAIENNFIFALMPIITGAMKLYDILTTIDGAIEAYDEGGPEALVKYGMEEASINLLMSSSMKFVGKMVNKARLAVKDTFKASSSDASSSASSATYSGAKAAKDVPTPQRKPENFSAKNANSSVNMGKKLSELQKAQSTAEKTKNLPDGRIRHYTKESPAKTTGPTRGRSHVTEYNPKTGQVRSWEETYTHTGQVNRVHPKNIDGQKVESTHYPLTGKEKQRLKK
ncbi:MAG: hypothetical protein KF820_08025 [Candidatus Paracaedibacteraceae bacterium]|nr:hypothetical protein [Candidatus Paracaedibacteraceae bacterium]